MASILGLILIVKSIFSCAQSSLRDLVSNPSGPASKLAGYYHSVPPERLGSCSLHMSPRPSCGARTRSLKDRRESSPPLQWRDRHIPHSSPVGTAENTATAS